MTDSFLNVKGSQKEISYDQMLRTLKERLRMLRGSFSLSDQILRADQDAPYFKAPHLPSI